MSVTWSVFADRQPFRLTMFVMRFIDIFRCRPDTVAFTTLLLLPDPDSIVNVVVAYRVVTIIFIISCHKVASVCNTIYVTHLQKQLSSYHSIEQEKCYQLSVAKKCAKYSKSKIEPMAQLARTDGHRTILVYKNVLQ